MRQSQKMEAVGQLTGGIAHDFNNLLTGIIGSLETARRCGCARAAAPNVERYCRRRPGRVQTRGGPDPSPARVLAPADAAMPKPTDVNRLVTEYGRTGAAHRRPGDRRSRSSTAGGLWLGAGRCRSSSRTRCSTCASTRATRCRRAARITIETGNKWLDDRTAKERDARPGQYRHGLRQRHRHRHRHAEVIARAFDPFFTTKPLGAGHRPRAVDGLWLRAAEPADRCGSIRRSGSGTTMCLYLPRHHRRRGRDVTMRRRPPAAAAGPKRAKTVLIVDDEPSVRMLVDRGARTSSATPCRRGVGRRRPACGSCNRRARIDLLITDVGLPGGLNGRQLADAARTTRPDLKVLFITGYAENAMHRQRPARARHARC